MGFHIVAYTNLAGVNDANVDQTAVPDTIFTVRNNHFILTEQYNLLYVYHQATSALRARLNVPSLNAIARPQIWPVERSATVPDDPRGLDLRNFPLALPTNEEIAVEETNNLGAATERSNTFMWIGDGGWNRNVPRGLNSMIVRWTSTIVVSANAWSADAPIVFAENLRGGWYDILGAWVVGASDLAFRLIFPRAQFQGTRQFRPGALCMEAVQNTPWEGCDEFGLWGSFHSFEPPTVQAFALAAGATALEGRFWVNYRGQGG
jgi:hypothetical protein